MRRRRPSDPRPAERAGRRPAPADAPGPGPALAARLVALARQLDPECDPAEWLAAIAPLLPDRDGAPLEDGLLSVVVRNHTLARLDLLDEALFSLACSEHRPLEIVLASQAPEDGAAARLAALLETHARLGEVTTRLVHEPSRADLRGRLANLGIAAARGRWLAFLDDDDVVYPDHHARLVAAARDGDRAWAVGRVRRVELRGGQVRTKEPWGAGSAFDLGRLARQNDVPVHAYVVDRARVRGLRIAFSERLARQEDDAFLLRLAGLFPPAVDDGPASCEYRFRDDGSNATPHAGASIARQVAATRAWSATRAPAAEARAATLAIRTMDELAELVAPRAPVAAGRELRYRIADRVNDALKRLPGMHAVLKATLGRRRR